MPLAFVTGATGFLGYAQCLELVEHGWTVRALTRSGSLPGELLARGITPVHGDLSDAARLAAAVDGVEAVFHVAADVSMWSARWVDSFASNVEGTRTLVEACLARGVRRFVHTSSGSTLGKPRHSDPRAPRRIDESNRYDMSELSMTYPHTKWLSEEVVLAARARGLEPSITHPTFIAGPWDHKQNLLPLFRAAARRALVVAPPGWRSVVDVRDVARGQRLIAEHTRPSERYVLAGESMPSAELFRRIDVALGVRGIRVTLPPGAMLALGRVMEAVAALRDQPPTLSREMAWQSTVAVEVSSAHARRELGFTTRPVEQSLADAVAWYRAQGLL